MGIISREVRYAADQQRIEEQCIQDFDGET
jgi:hypothetical protein